MNDLSDCVLATGIWGWGLNLHYLHDVKVDVPSLIRYPPRQSSSHPPHHLSTYRLAAALSTIFGFSMVVFWVFSRRDPELVIFYDWMPMTLLVIIAVLFAIPLRSWSLSHAGRWHFLLALRRVSIGGLDGNGAKFGDILLADVLTSYSKVLGDLFVCICMFFTADGSATDRPDRSCGGTVVVPLIMALPFAIRFRQCLIEYMRVKSAPGALKESAGWGGAHLANAAKYASAFPVIILSALQRSAEGAPTPGLYRAWLGAVLLNSLFSFYWDVARDWDLTLFSDSRARNNPDHPVGLRRRLYIQPAPSIYYVVIVLDLVLRCTWSLKLSPHLDRISGFESSIFVVEFLEIFRRWVWMFFRIETEWIRGSNAAMGFDDMVLLDDFQGKYQDEE
jgi:hypothetical protein